MCKKCAFAQGKQIDHTDKMDEHEKDTWQMWKHKTKPAFSQIHIQPMSKGPRPTKHKGNMQHAQTKPLRNKNTCSWFHERMNDCDLTSAHWNDVYLADIVCHEPLVVYAKRWLTVHEWQINGVLIVSVWCQRLYCLLIGMTCGFWIFLVLTWSVLSHAVNITCLSRTAGCLCLVSHSSQCKSTGSLLRCNLSIIWRTVLESHAWCARCLYVSSICEPTQKLQSHPPILGEVVTFTLKEKKATVSADQVQNLARRRAWNSWW